MSRNFSLSYWKSSTKLSETTQQSASTIHRLLKYDPSTRAFHNKDNPLACDCIIVDEASMIDTN